MRHAPGGDALPDAGVHPGPRDLQPPQLAQREGSHIQQAAVGAAQLLKQHLDGGYSAEEDNGLLKLNVHVPILLLYLYPNEPAWDIGGEVESHVPVT